MPLRNVASTFTIEQQRLEINNLAGDVNNIATGVTNVGSATTASALAAGATGEDLTLSGTLTVNGTQTILNTATLEVEDKNIVIAKGATTDAAANTGGITLKGANDKTITYSSTGDKWVSNKDFEAPSLLVGDVISSGNVGIGTGTDPIDRKLHVKSSGLIAKLESTSANALIMFATPTNETAGTVPNIGANDNDLEFTTGNLTRLKIHSDGQVTLGNDHAGAATWDGDLVVANSTGGRISVGDTGSGERFDIAANGDINLYSYLNGDNINFHTTDGNGTSNRMKIQSDGNVLPGADDAQDLGSATFRWANVYTGDLHLSNEGAGNDVDGTSGSWTMQEGANDLFLINRNTGKKYKFNLTEVS